MIFTSLPLLLLLCHELWGLSPRTLDAEVGPVVYVNMLYRHGDRTIIDPAPKDPYKDPKFWPDGFGQLTNQGILHHYKLGIWLRQRYNYLIPSGKYSRDLIRVLSTDVDRALMSAEANLAGMFPPSTDWSSDIKWRPIPVHTVPTNLDKLLYMEKVPCRAYEKAWKIFKKSKQYEELNSNYRDLYKYLSNHTGREANDFLSVEYLYSNLLIENMFNYTLPNWTKSVFPGKMIEPAGISFAIGTWTLQMKRLLAGPLIKDMLTTMTQKLNGTLDPPARSFSMYSAHDNTVGRFLNALGMFNMLPPPFAALVLVELRNSSSGYVVTVLYKNSSDPFADPILLQPPYCTVACPFEKFKDLYKDIIPVDWDAECSQHDFFDLSTSQPYNSIAIFAIVTSILIIFFIFVMMSLVWNRQRSKYLYDKLNIEPL